MSTQYKNLIILLLMVGLLTACTTNGIISNPLKLGSSSSSTKEVDGALTVLTVEYGSGSPIPNMNVQLTDVSKGEIIDSTMSSNEGVAEFAGLEEGKTYSINASLSESDFPSVEEFTYSKSKEYHVVRTNSTNDERIPIPAVMQNPELPNGCEITALTAVLNYYGLQLTKTDMAKKYLPQQDFRSVKGKRYGADPNNAYTGSPFEKEAASYVYAAPIVQAANNAISDYKLPLQVTNVSGQSAEEIVNLINQGVPVVIWVTLDLSEPKKKTGWIIEDTNKYHEMYKNLHAVVLTGINSAGDKVTVMDPLKGNIQLNKVDFFKSYEALGKQAVAIHR